MRLEKLLIRLVALPVLQPASKSPTKACSRTRASRPISRSGDSRVAAASATSKAYEPDLGGCVEAKLNSVEPRRSPETAAPLTVATALTAERCCGN